jgi:ArsR family transcriptional regulator, virulence genes transcriptional regulator
MPKSAAAEMKTLSRKADEAADLLRAMAHGARLRVLCELAGGERSAGELVEASGLGQSALSQHLARLRADGLVTTRRDAQTIYYSLADARVRRLIGLLYELYCGK